MSRQKKREGCDSFNIIIHIISIVLLLIRIPESDQRYKLFQMDYTMGHRSVLLAIKEIPGAIVRTAATNIFPYSCSFSVGDRER